jgi:signal transduction histidine kinase
MLRLIDRIISVPSSEPDDIRRGRILNILLLGVFVLAFATLPITIIASDTLKDIVSGDVRLIYLVIISVFIGTIVIYAINRRSRPVAAFLFLLFLTAVLSFSDSPSQIVSGRSTFIFTLPIAISSLLLFPLASFIFTIIAGFIMFWLAASISTVPNTFALTGFFLLALVSWLTTRNLEQALSELRTTNTNLDKLVHERTQALTESLARERIEAGRNEAILNSIADGVIVFDMKWNSTLANPAIVNLLDTPFVEIVDHDVNDWLNSGNISAKSRGTLLAMLENPERMEESIRVEWGNKTLSVNAAQVYESSGEKIGTVAVFRDFTREAEVERMKSTFVAIVSHELRTPLNAVLGYAEMLREAVYGPVNKKQSGAVDRIMTNTHHLLDLVSDLLDQAQIEAGKLKIHVESFKIAELLGSVHDIMDKIATDKELTLTSEIDPGLPEKLNGDPYRLRQILINLTNNAVKFTTQGDVRIRLFRHDSAYWGISVQDTGDGIPNDEIPHIFETFRQVDGTTTRQYGGIGLGLSIVKQLVTLMQGEINVTSELGSGSTFTILLPLNITITERTIS